MLSTVHQDEAKVLETQEGSIKNTIYVLSSVPEKASEEIRGTEKPFGDA